MDCQKSILHQTVIYHEYRSIECYNIVVLIFYSNSLRPTTNLNLFWTNSVGPSSRYEQKVTIMAGSKSGI